MANALSPYEYYLDLLGSWSTGVALPTLWFCTFDIGSVNCLKGTTQTQLNKYETSLGNSGWGVSNNTIRYLTNSSLQYSSDSLMGCVFAKEVNLPSDTVNATHDGLDYGGYMAPLTISERNKYINLDVTFLETNASFVDLVLRPWSVLVGYNGFVARSKNSSKNVQCSRCDVCMLAKTGADSPLAIRKIYRFYNIAPVNISREMYNHTPDTLKTTPVSFAYDGYVVLEQDTTSMLTV